MSAITLVVVVLRKIPWLIAATLFAAAIGASIVDAAGNVPFLGAVRSHEQAKMTSVVMTYRDRSQLIPPAMFSVMLRVIELNHVFTISAAGLLLLVVSIKQVPRRLYSLL